MMIYELLTIRTVGTAITTLKISELLFESNYQQYIFVKLLRFKISPDKMTFSYYQSF